MKKTSMRIVNFFLFFSIFFLFSCGTTQDEVKTDNQSGNLLLVSVEEVQSKPFKHTFAVNGSIEAIHSAVISPETNGQIKAIHIKEGQRVRKGELLVTLSSSILENSIDEAKTGLDLARKLFDKQEELWSQKIGSEVQYLQAKSTKDQLETRVRILQAQLDMTRIVAPFDGIVDDITQKVGELASPGMKLLDLVDLSEVYINADVAESYLPFVNNKDSVYVTFSTYPDLKIKTTVHRIGNIINTQNRTFQVQLKIKNVDEKLKPNLMASVEMSDFESDKAILIASIVIKKDLSGEYVFIIKKTDNRNIAEKRYVKTSYTAKENTLIESGLNIGDQVITQGYNLVKNGMEVKIK